MFSQYCFVLFAGGSADSSVKLWDLRKQLCVHTLRLEKGYGVKALQFDHSGSYVAVAGADVVCFVFIILLFLKIQIFGNFFHVFFVLSFPRSFFLPSQSVCLLVKH